jgi:hypothetical protein
MATGTYLHDATERFRDLKALADGALAQVAEADWFVVPYEDGNSLAVIVKHLAGNLRSRWTAFLTTDGEKPDRHRDTEFRIGAGDTREALLARWEAGWAILFATLAELAAEDLERTVRIRGEPHSVVGAINRQLTHYGYHVGQLVGQARACVGAAWRTLSVPRGQTEAFNAEMARKWGPSPPEPPSELPPESPPPEPRPR